MAKAELLSIGTELLLGQITNTNSQFLAKELAELGIDVLYQVTVGDNTGRIVESLRTALSRSDIVISTGGLGPTADDLTHESIAELFNLAMTFDQATLERIEALFRLRGVKMVDSNRKQAQRPEGSEILYNAKGTAPGIIFRPHPDLLEKAGIEDPGRPRLILTFPGVPGEMKSMWAETAVPLFRKHYGAGVVWSIDLKHYGIGESTMAEKYSNLLDMQNPTVAPLAGQGECRLRVTAKAGSVEEAQKLAQPIIEKIKNESGYLCYGINDEHLETVLARLLMEKGLTLSVSESCTGGLVSKRLTDIAGSSAYTGLNLVTYSNTAKSQLLKVASELLEKHGAVSAECAKAMAEGTMKLSGADIGLSITGIAGPEGGSKEKPVGLVYMAVATAKETIVSTKRYPSQFNRSEIRLRSASDALNMVRLYLIDPSLLKEERADQDQSQDQALSPLK